MLAFYPTKVMDKIVGMGMGSLILWPRVFDGELRKGYDKYEFEGRNIIVHTFFSRAIHYSIDDITMCEFKPQCALYNGLYSDAVFLSVRNEKHPIRIFRNYHENFEEFRRWILDNNIKVEIHDKYFGEQEPSYVSFMNKDSYKKPAAHKQKKSSQGRKYKYERIVTLKNKSGWIFKYFFLPGISLYGIIYCQYIFPIESTKDLIEKIIVCLLVILFSGVGVFILEKLLCKTFTINITKNKLTIKSLCKTREYKVTKLHDVEYEVGKRMRSGQYGDQLRFNLDSRINMTRLVMPLRESHIYLPASPKALQS